MDIGFLGYLPIAELVDLSQSKSEAFEIEQILLPHGDLSAEHPVPRCGVSGKLQSVYPILPLLVDLDLEVRHLIGLAIDHLVGCDVEIPLFAVIQLDPPQPLFHRTVVENLSRLDGNPGKDFLLRKDLVPFHREGPDLVLGSLLDRNGHEDPFLGDLGLLLLVFLRRGGRRGLGSPLALGLCLFLRLPFRLPGGRFGHFLFSLLTLLLLPCLALPLLFRGFRRLLV